MIFSVCISIFKNINLWIIVLVFYSAKQFAKSFWYDLCEENLKVWNNLYAAKYRFHIHVLGAQLSSRCFSIDGSSSKCWSILTYLKRHEPSLDIW